MEELVGKVSSHPLATGREKRQNAGNRLQAMLHNEIEQEVLFADEEDDTDFGSDQDKQDDIESEFDSTDDEAEIQGQDDCDNASEAREDAKQRLRSRRAVHQLSKPKITKRPVPYKPPGEPQTGRDSAREKAQRGQPRKEQHRRQSSRAHALRVKDAVDKRLLEVESRRAKTPGTRTVEVTMTQAERLAEAVLTEAKNVQSLTEIAHYEEITKTNQTLLAQRKRNMGPTVRFTSNMKSATMCTDSATINQIEFHNIPDSQPDLQSLIFPIKIRTKHTQKPLCPISGVPAIYRDPVTGVYFGDARAYNVIKQVRDGRVPWNPLLGLYVT